MNPPTIRRLLPADAPAFRDLRLDGLQRDPAAFGAAYDDERAQPLSWFAARIAEHAVFGAHRDDARADATLAGVAALMVPSGAKLRHKGVLWGMYVRPDARGAGIAAALVDTVLRHARGHVDEVKLEVSPDNAAAIRLYEAAGFTIYAREPRALRIGDVYHDSLLMRRRVG